MFLITFYGRVCDAKISSFRGDPNNSHSFDIFFVKKDLIELILKLISIEIHSFKTILRGINCNLSTQLDHCGILGG